jgi:hypothetical protein
VRKPINPYKVRIGGVLADPYRILRAYEIDDAAVGQAIKKLLRLGRRHKSAAKDIAEAISSLRRWQEMESEDARPVQRSKGK